MALGSSGTHLAPASLSSDLGFLSLLSPRLHPEPGESWQRELKVGRRKNCRPRCGEGWAVAPGWGSSRTYLLYSHHTGGAGGMGGWDLLPLARSSDGQQEEAPACPEPYGWRLP